MKPSTFEYHAPETVDEAVALLTELGDEAKVLAGGQSLVPMLSLRLAYFDHLVDVGRIDDLRGIRHEADAVHIGATTVDAALERDGELATRVPLLARATPFVGHFQIRNRGTVGGSIAHADPAAEYPTVALTLDAEVEVASSRGRRTVPARDLFTGFWTTALDADELLVGLRFPVWAGRCGFGVREFARRFGDFAIAGAAVAVQLDDDDRIQRCAIGLLGLGLDAAAGDRGGGGGPRPGRRRSASTSWARWRWPTSTRCPSDIHGSASYRKRVGAAMVGRALTDAMTEATGG